VTQLAFRLKQPRKKPKRGGKRAGAGRPRVRPLPIGWRPGRRFVARRTRAKVDRHAPLHVTMRFQHVVRNLRNGKLHRVIHGAIARCHRADFRVVHYSVQGDHVHLIAEAHSAEALSSGMQGLTIRVAKAMNRRLERSGAVMADRYHAVVLGSPTQVRSAILYVLNNARKHAAQTRGWFERGWIDPFSSAADFDGWARAVEPDRLALPRCTAAAGSWLLRVGWRRRGLLEPGAVPSETAAPAFDG
jgi:REP element-mobilizing transposase RayT